jgi:hypothetical protein
MCSSVVEVEGLYKIGHPQEQALNGRLVEDAYLRFKVNDRKGMGCCLRSVLNYVGPEEFVENTEGAHDEQLSTNVSHGPKPWSGPPIRIIWKRPTPFRRCCCGNFTCRHDS